MSSSRQPTCTIEELVQTMNAMEYGIHAAIQDPSLIDYDENVLAAYKAKRDILCELLEYATA